MIDLMLFLLLRHRGVRAKVPPRMNFVLSEDENDGESRSRGDDCGWSHR
jgi:hypothetical protein